MTRDHEPVVLCPAQPGWRAAFLHSLDDQGWWPQDQYWWSEPVVVWSHCRQHRGIHGYFNTEGSDGLVCAQSCDFFWYYLAPGEADPTLEQAKAACHWREKLHETPKQAAGMTMPSKSPLLSSSSFGNAMSLNG